MGVDKVIHIVKNKNNIKDSEITDTVIRVKALIRNSKNDILLGYSHCEYQFPGGHVKDNEGLLLALKRELKEETGLDYKVTNLTPFACLETYYKDYPVKGQNLKAIIYYYEILDDRVPSLKDTNYTMEELDGNFKLRYIPSDIVLDVLKDNMNMYGDVAGVAQEMIELFEKYLNY